MENSMGTKAGGLKNGWNRNLTQFTICPIISRKGYQFSDANRE
jgi:hypothetical protein